MLSGRARTTNMIGRQNHGRYTVLRLRCEGTNNATRDALGLRP